MHKTGLHWAIKRRNLEMAGILIDAGADVNARDIVIHKINLNLADHMLLDWKNSVIFRSQTKRS